MSSDRKHQKDDYFFPPTLYLVVFFDFFVFISSTYPHTRAYAHTRSRVRAQ